MAIPQTPLSASTPYCTVQDLFVYHDWCQVGDYIKAGTEARPSLGSMLDATTAYGAVVNQFLMSGAGRIESMCLIGNRYRPADLKALTGASAQALRKLNADVSFWQMAQRRQPNASDPRNVPGAMEAADFLKALRDGEAVFGFEETAEAGLPEVVQANPARLLTPNVIATAYRLFPLAQINLLDGRGGN